MTEKPSIRGLLRAENARKILRGLLVHGTGWLKLAGALVLLTADIWLGVSVLQAKGMDLATAVLLSVALSALQIALFQRGIQILQKVESHWQLVQGIMTLVIGWIIVVGDSILDGSASFVKLGKGLPNTWSEFGTMLKNPYILLGFILLFFISFLGERMARLAIYGEHDEETESLPQPVGLSREAIQSMREAARERELLSRQRKECLS